MQKVEVASIVDLNLYMQDIICTLLDSTTTYYTELLRLVRVRVNLLSTVLITIIRMKIKIKG